MYNSQEEVIYVGKVKNFKKCVLSYFCSNFDNVKMCLLVSQIVNMDVMVVNSEIEVFLFENNFIKKYKLCYNVVMCDDKFYFFIFLFDYEYLRFFFYCGF